MNVLGACSLFLVAVAVVLVCVWQCLCGGGSGVWIRVVELVNSAFLQNILVSFPFFLLNWVTIDVTTGAACAGKPQPTAAASDAPQFVVCFDFDQCLMKGHWWGKHKNNALDTVNPQPDDFAHDDIGDLFDRLFAIEGVKVAVASFGRQDVIYKAISSVVGDEQADEVYITTPGDFDGYRDGCGARLCSDWGWRGWASESCCIVHVRLGLEAIALFHGNNTQYCTPLERCVFHILTSECLLAMTSQQRMCRCSMGEHYKNAELDKVCEDLGVQPEQIIFFDDSNPNITHACGMGVNAFTTAPFTRDHEVHIAAHLGRTSV
jgi:hypothetical protein